MEAEVHKETVALKKRVQELECALRASGELEARLQSIVSGSSNLFFVLSREGVHLDYHIRDESILFIPPSEFMGKSVLETLPAEMAIPYQKAIEQSLDEKRTVAFEYPLPIGGDTKHFEARIHPMDAERVCVIIRDITSRIKTERALRASDLRFRQIANTVDEVFWIGEPFTARAIYISPAWERIYGCPLAEIYADSTNWLKYIHPEDLEKVQSEFIRAQNTGVMDVEHRIIRADKTMRWVRTRSFPIHDEEGNLFRMSGIAQDITEFKAVEEELRLSKLQLEERVRARTKDLARINQELKTEIENRRQSESRFRTVTDTVPAIVAVHRGGKYLFVNRATCAITGYSMEELLDMNFWELASPEYQGTLKRRGQARMVGEAPPNRYEIQIFTKSGQPRWLLLSISMIEYEGEPAVLGTGYDITDRRNVELELKRAKEAADAANAAKSEFLANMSHEIRTPISAILGFAEMLKTRATEHNEYSDYANGILRNGQHLLELVNDVLDLSKIEAGEFRVTNSRFSLEEELAVILDMVYARVEEKRLQLKVIYDCPVPREIFSDQTRFRQILINIVGNAIKFTLEGSIGIHVCLNKTGERPMLELRVEDTGVGISGSQQNALFEPFSQGEHTFSRRFGGTGLGLTLARKHARALGGDVQLVRSQPGCGSVFLISVDPGPISGIETVQSFTYSRRQNSAGVRSQNSPLQDYRVLLVEDGIDNQVLFAHFLEDAGAIVDIANDGLEALRIANNKQHDLILMDIQLPELDGYEATRTLRQNHYTKPIVALTAHAMIEERERCLQAGCDDCLTKPIESATLISEVKKWAASGRSAAAH